MSVPAPLPIPRGALSRRCRRVLQLAARCRKAGAAVLAVAAWPAAAIRLDRRPAGVVSTYHILDEEGRPRLALAHLDGIRITWRLAPRRHHGEIA